MALTQIDEVAALIVIDMQKGIAALPAAHPIAEIADHIARLARAFRAKDMPVILVNVAGVPPGRSETKFNFSPPPNWTDFIPELDRQPSDYTVTKFNIGAFYGTGLERILRRANATQVFMTGVATSLGVESTARSAFDHGFNVVLVTDAMTDREADKHRHSIEKIFPRIGETTTTEDVLAGVNSRR